MNMIRSRSSLTIPPSESIVSLSEKSIMTSPPRLIRSSSYHRQSDDSPSKMSDDDGNHNHGGVSSSQTNIPKSSSNNSSHRYMKWFVLLVFVGAAVYFFIIVYFGALFIRDIDIVEISETHFEQKNQVTVLINTFKRKDMVHGKSLCILSFKYL
jgi:hypothetical protein